LDSLLIFGKLDIYKCPFFTFLRITFPEEKLENQFTA
jgi:hypothetical protein